jgi:hypothetical protein
MKNTILTALFVLASSAFAETTVEKDLGKFRDWNTALVSGHALWEDAGCMSSVKANDKASTLEVYAHQQDDPKEGHSDIAIQIVARKLPEFVRAILKTDDSSEDIHLTLATGSQAQPVFGLLARLDDRAKLVAKFKKANTASVVFVSAKNKGVKTLRFSLRGFTKAFENVTAKCALTAVE